jgi:LysR family transcriptional regulator, low CO2-responsive transcriptional regulator
MDTDQLLAFQRVVREGSFSRAGRTLNIGQPAVSARIAALEAQLGGALIVRGRRLSLTPLGVTFLPFVERALDTLDEGTTVARLSQSHRGGRVTLAALGSLSGGLLGPALSQFVRAHPAVECSMRSGDHEFVLQLLADRVVDLGLIAWPCRDAAARELVQLAILHEPVLLVAHPKHGLARRRRVTRAELMELGRPFLRLRWWTRHHPELQAIADGTGSALEVPMQAARHLVLEGAAVGFFTRTLVAEELERGALVRVDVSDLPAIERQSALVRRTRTGPMTPPMRAFVDAIRRQATLLGLLPSGAAQKAASLQRPPGKKRRSRDSGG